MANLGMIGASRGAHVRARRGGGRRVTRLFIVVIVVVVIVAAVQWFRGVPGLSLEMPSTVTWKLAGTAPALPWPSAGSAAMAEMGVGDIGSSGSTQPAPIASVTKVLAALVVLHDHPLSIGQSGPAIAVPADVVSAYHAGLAGGQSEVTVAAGESLTELQVLQALIVGSGNDMATLLADWDAGGTAGLVTKMNSAARTDGLVNTHITDPSGLDPANVSNVADLVRLGELAMANPVLAQVVGSPQVQLPVAGTIENLNADLGHDGIVGLKTGITNAAGGCFLFAASQQVDGQKVTLVGAVLGQQGAHPLQAALAAADALVRAGFAAAVPTDLVPAGVALGSVHAPWGSDVALSARSTPQVVAVPGIAIEATVVRHHLPGSLAGGAAVADLVLSGSGRQEVVVRTTAAVPGPSLRWRLTRL